MDPRISGRVWVEPASRRVLAGREGMGVGRLGGSRAPNGLFCTPRSDHQKQNDGRPMDAMDDQPLHLQRDMTPSTHIEACMTMSVRRRAAPLAPHSSHPHSSVSHIDIWPRGPQFGMAGGRGVGGYGIDRRSGLLRAVGGYGTARDKGPAPYPTGQKSGTQLLSRRIQWQWRRPTSRRSSPSKTPTVAAIGADLYWQRALGRRSV